jgi:hypothetical protein
MSIRNQILDALGKSTNFTGDSSRLTADYILSQRNPDGGFKGRDESSDIYYTMFAVEILSALGEKWDCRDTRKFLRSFLDDLPADIVHLAGLIRCLKAMDMITAKIKNTALEHLQRLFERDYSAYGCFLMLGACQDLDADIPDACLLEKLRSLKKKSGAYANNTSTRVASTNATAAAIVVRCSLSQSDNAQACRRLVERCSPDGGFCAGAGIDIPDMLSTATSLYALKISGRDIKSLAGPALDFIDSLWDGKGGFCGSWADTQTDIEYTFYGLLALGMLA